MKIALIGYGKMGKAIEKIALQRGHSITLIIDKNNAAELTSTNLKKCNVAIEFSNPENAFDNINKCLNAAMPMVVGTTGWLNNLAQIQNIVLEKKLHFVYASNFSLGANLFFELNKKLAMLINNYVNTNEYNVLIEETHHTQKLDAPSGTALTLANDLLKNLDAKKHINALGVTNKSILESTENIFSTDLTINALRRDDVAGTHTINYCSQYDDITITHTAHNRTGFALGAVLAAEKIISTQGFFEFRDLLFA